MKRLAERNGKPVGDLSILRRIVEKEDDDEAKTKVYSYWHLFRNRKIALKTVVICMLLYVSLLFYLSHRLGPPRADLFTIGSKSGYKNFHNSYTFH